MTRFEETAKAVFRALDLIGTGRIERAVLISEGPRSYELPESQVCTHCYSRPRHDGSRLCASCQEQEIRGAK